MVLHIHAHKFEMIKSVEFVKEQKPDRISFSVRFFDVENQRLIAAFFTKCMMNQKFDF